MLENVIKYMLVWAAYSSAGIFIYALYTLNF